MGINSGFKGLKALAVSCSFTSHRTGPCSNQGQSMWDYDKQNGSGTGFYSSTSVFSPVHFSISLLKFAGRVAQSVQRRVTEWTVRGSNPGEGEILRTCPDRPWGPPSLLYNGYRIFPGGKERSGRDADPSPPSSAIGHERVELYLYSPYGPYGLYKASVPVQGVHFTSTLPLKFQSSLATNSVSPSLPIFISFKICSIPQGIYKVPALFLLRHMYYRTLYGMMDHENAQSIFHDGTENKTKVSSILIQQSVFDTKQVGCHEHAARSDGN